MWGRIRQRCGEFAADWAGPIGLGLAAAGIVWVVWYFTRAVCTTTAATNGLCTPGLVARFIDVQILLQAAGAALAVGALKGGYDKFMMRRMLNEEREARQQAEQQLAVERKRVDETIQQANEARDAALQMVSEMVNEFREERREERRLAAEERQRDAVTRQALLDAVLQLTQQRNGRPEDPSGE